MATFAGAAEPLSKQGFLQVGGAGEYPRLAKAVKLDRIAALKSASWGAGE